MRVDVFFGAAQLPPAHVTGRVVAVVDVLRASTTIAVALANGAKNVVPVESSDEAILRSKAFERAAVLLCGERKLQAIPGFDAGNSPLEFTREVVDGKTVLLTTTNGTPALLATQGARDVVVASFVNFSAVLAMLRAALRGGADVSIICAGQDRQFALEDAACAGRYARYITNRITDVEMNDGARASALLDRRYGDRLDKLFADSAHGRALVDAGFAGDLEVCAAVDAYPVIPLYHDRSITKLGPERER
jgi:2-phosphosulfolactate phosphatase